MVKIPLENMGDRTAKKEAPKNRGKKRRKKIVYKIRT